MTTPNVSFKIKARDDTKAAFDSLGKKLNSVKASTTAMLGIFAGEKVIEFFKQSLTEASKYDTAVQKSFTELSDLYRGFQVETGKIVLQNKDMIESFLTLAKDIAPFVLKSIAAVAVTLRKLADIVQIAINGFKMMGRVFRGESIDDLVAQNTQLSANVLTVDDYVEAIGAVPSALTPVSEKVKENTQALKNQREELLTIDQLVAKMTLVANSPRRRNEEAAKAVFEQQKTEREKQAEEMRKLNDRISRGLFDPTQVGPMPEVGEITLPTIIGPSTQQQLDLQADILSTQFKNSFGNVFQQGIVDIFQNGDIRTVLGNVFDMLRSGIQEGIARMTIAWVKGTSVFTSIQAKFYAFYGKIMSSLAGLLSNPFTAGFAAVGIAVALAGLSRSLGGQARGVGGVPTSAYGATVTAVNGTNTLGDNRGTTTLVIQGGFLNMNDPRQAAQFQQALQSLTGRRVVLQGA